MVLGKEIYNYADEIVWDAVYDGSSYKVDGYQWRRIQNGIRNPLEFQIDNLIYSSIYRQMKYGL